MNRVRHWLEHRREAIRFCVFAVHDDGSAQRVSPLTSSERNANLIKAEMGVEDPWWDELANRPEGDRVRLEVRQL